MEVAARAHRSAKPEQPEPEPWIYKEVVAEDVAEEEPRWDVQEELLRVESEEHRPPAVNTTACQRLCSLGCVAHTDGAVFQLASGQPPPALQQLAARGPEAWGEVEERMPVGAGGDREQQARENAALLQELAVVDAELARRRAADGPEAFAQEGD